MGLKKAKTVAAAACIPMVSKKISNKKPKEKEISNKGIVFRVLGKINKPNKYKKANAYPNRAKFFKNKS
jgi:hypothetical protein